jgi:hypothetical protein
VDADMENDSRQVPNTQKPDNTTIRHQSMKARDKQSTTTVISTRLLWIPIAIQLISGLTILGFPKIWQRFFLVLAIAYPELSVNLGRSMLAAGTFLSLLAGINLFVMSAYLQKARWAWILFFFIISIGWGGWLFVLMNAGITLAAILSVAVILLGWIGLGMSVSEFFGSKAGASILKRS